MSQWPPVVVVEDNELNRSLQAEHIPMSMDKEMTDDSDRSLKTGTNDCPIKSPDLNCPEKIVKHKLEKFAVCHAIPK